MGICIGPPPNCGTGYDYPEAFARLEKFTELQKTQSMWKRWCAQQFGYYQSEIKDRVQVISYNWRGIRYIVSVHYVGETPAQIL